MTAATRSGNPGDLRGQWVPGAQPLIRRFNQLWDASAEISPNGTPDTVPVLTPGADPDGD